MLYTAEERIAQTTGNATLYAFDAQTGKELFSSGKLMPSFTHFAAVAVSDGGFTPQRTIPRSTRSASKESSA